MGKWDHLQTCDERVLVALDADDFPQAIAILVRGYKEAVVGYCVWMMDDAEEGTEVAQEVFCAVDRALPGFRRQASIRTFVFAIARNQCLKRHASLRRRERLFRNKRWPNRRERAIRPNKASLLDREGTHGGFIFSGDIGQR
jgi:RNA polymerase sigma factor (sigma-70 family)